MFVALSSSPAFSSWDRRQRSLSPLERPCECFDLHRSVVPYRKAWDWQKRIVDEKKAAIGAGSDCPDSLIVLQHRPVYTMGTGSSGDVDDSRCEVYRIDRGGKDTFHGPGQLVLYPIINLRNHQMDLHWYLRALEEVVIRVLSNTFSIKASRIEGLTGVWVGNQKVAAIGIKVSRWITYHGLALNVTTDLTSFNRIVPCGIRDRQVGSVKDLLAESQPFNIHGIDDRQLIDIASQSLINEFSQFFRLEIHHKTVLDM